MIFGTAGIPRQCKGDSVKGVQCVHELGLGAMELEFVHSVNLKPEKARLVGEAAKKSGVKLSCHAPYYVNLLSAEKKKREASKQRILKACESLQAAGGGCCVFHPAFYGGRDSRQALEECSEELADLSSRAKKFGNVLLAPETTGKKSQFGSLDELLEGVGGNTWFCVDFAHLHARENGALKEKKDFDAVLQKIAGALGKKALKKLHCHFSGIEFTEKGERRHLPVSSESPDFSLLAESLNEFGAGGTVICESPLVEKDALKLKKEWEKVRSL
jgi:deoxyribonuclease IV